jgi:hypothetical protein
MPLKGKDRVATKLKDKADRLVRGVALESLGRLIRRTPVDTGRARGNWNVAIGSTDPTHDMEFLDPQGTAALQGGQQVIGEFRAGERLFLTNSVPYVEELERGHSKQAPQGMVAVTAAEMRPLVSQVVAKLRDE